MRSTLLRAPQRSEGFSLLEVLVALTILGIGVVSLIQLFSGSLGTVKKSEDYSKALIYARSLLDEAYSMPDLLDVEETFNFKEGFTATRSVRFVAAEKNATLYEISVVVRWLPSGFTELKGIRTIREKEL